jgi:glycerol-3-phosphate dehydrogenase (NAD(P)+)
MPVQQTPTVLKELSPHFPKKIPFIIVSKGILIESATDFPFLSGWIDNFIPGHPVFVLSGPNLAGEIAKGLPAAATLAFPDAALAQEMAKSLWHTQFRLYPSTDRFGVEFCGAVKNVYAIACGICVGMNLGQNALASLMTRSLAEMKRLGLAMGADIETFLGLAGVGDLMLTCTSIQSRNMSFGMELAKGNSVAEISAHRHTIAEGVATSKALNQIIKAKTLSMPIADAIFAIVHQGANVKTVISELLNRQSNQFESF